MGILHSPITEKIRKYNELVEMFLKTEELGHYDPNNWSICLYDIVNRIDIIEDIHRRIKTITDKYRLVIFDKYGMFTNVSIIDIEL